MSTLQSLKVAIKALIANKMRSSLTMLGVTIGVLAVILLVAIGTGVKQDVTGQIEGIGSNLLFVMPGKIETGGEGHGGMQGTMVNRLSTEHVRRLEEGGGNISEVVPLIEGTGATRYRNRTWNTVVVGTSANYFPVRHWDLFEGRFFSENQVSASRKVAVLGKTVYDELFEGRRASGQRISISGQKFTVAGVLVSKGSMMGQNWDDAILIPLTTAKRLFAIENVSMILIEAKSGEVMADAKADAKRILGRDLRSEEFSVIGQDEAADTLNKLLGTLTLMVAGLASISLVVGGVGIMNIMLVSVTERTREIGLRKAVGAKVGTIMTQFIIEAVVLSVAGGAVGIAGGVAGAYLLKSIVATLVPVWSIVLSFCFAAGVGVFFGAYPALKAARLEPIDALRYE